MRTLLVLVLLAIAAVGAFLSRPNIEAQRKHTADVLDQKRKDSGATSDVGGFIGAVIEDANRTDSFEDMMVATKLTTRSGDNVLLECWGAYSQFLCAEPAEKKSN